MDSRVLKGHGFTNREEILVRTDMSKGTTSVVPLSPPFIRVHWRRGYFSRTALGHLSHAMAKLI